MTLPEIFTAGYQVLAALATLGTFICTFIALKRLGYARETLEIIHTQTNSLTEQLVKATGAARFEAGKLEGQTQNPDPAIAHAATKILAIAAAQAAKVLATTNPGG